MTAFFGDRTIDDEALPFWTERMGDLARRHAGFVGPQAAGTSSAFSTERRCPAAPPSALATVTRRDGPTDAVAARACCGR